MQFYFLVVSPRNRGREQGRQEDKGDKGELLNKSLSLFHVQCPMPNSPFPIPPSPFPHPLEIAKILSN
ncbi:hypothetical protein FBB35_07480 [Nostoc sp. TCL240-02]|nr:hypothetical protein FBB35_07480 [Nostoc sp. TCL240-02]